MKRYGLFGGNTLHREKINTIYIPQRLKKRLWSIYTDKVTIISARSGCGKSTFISEFISHTKNDVLPHMSVKYIRKAESWRDCFMRLSKVICGRRIELPLSVEEQLEARRVFENAKPQRDLLVVIDNPFAAGMLLNNPRVAELICDSTYIRLVITAETLNTNLFNSADAFGFTVINENELLLTAEETTEYFELCDMESADAKNAYDICGGHMMLTREYLEAAVIGKEPVHNCDTAAFHNIIWESIDAKTQFAMLTTALMRFLDDKMCEELNKSKILQQKYGAGDIDSDKIRALINSAFDKKLFWINGKQRRIYCHPFIRKQIMEQMKLLPEPVGREFGRAIARYFRRLGNNFMAFCVYTLSGDTEAAFNCGSADGMTIRRLWEYRETMLMALKKIPHNLAVDMPKYLVVTTMVMLTDKSKEASTIFSEAAAAILKDRAISEHDRRRLLAHVCLMRMPEGQFSIPKMGGDVKRAWRYYTAGMNLRPPPFPWSLYTPSAFMLLYDPKLPLETQKEQFLRYQGMYSDMLGHGRHICKLYTAETYLYSGNFTEARRLSELALKTDFEPSELADKISLLFLCGKACLYEGDYTRFGEVLTELMGIARQNELNEEGFMARHCFADLSCYDGSGEKNGYFMLCVSDKEIQRRRFCAASVYLSQALILYVSKRYDILIRRTPLFLETTKHSAGLLIKLKIKVLYAAALLEIGDKNAAADVLYEVFNQFKHSGLYGAFSEVLAISRALSAVTEQLLGNEEYVRKTLALARTLQRGIEVAFTYRLSKFSIRSGSVLLDTVRKVTAANDEKRRTLGLSAGEFGCCCLAAGGYTNTEIAYILKRSPDSVKSCLKRAFSKLNIRTRKQLPSIVPLIGK